MRKIVLAALAAAFLAGTAFAANGAVSKSGKGGKAEMRTVAKNTQKNSQKEKTDSKTKKSKVSATNKKPHKGRGNTRTKKSVK